MLRTPLAGLLVLCSAATVVAEQPIYKAVVTDAEVKLRAGPSDSFPETGTLHKGAVVVVEKEETNGWLAVTSYGSVSWIATQFVEDKTPELPAPKKVFVSGEDEVTLAAGKVGLNEPLDIRRTKIPNGTTLVVLGPKVTLQKRTWYMIQSPPGDFRYLPKTAIQFEKPANNNFTVRVNETVTPLPAGADSNSKTFPATPAGGAVAAIQGPGVTPASGGGATVSKPTVNHPLWAQAETAERENRLTDAEKLYFQLAEEMNRANGDHDIANLCYTRIHAIREKQRGARGAGAPSSAASALRSPSPVKDEVVARPSSNGDRSVKVGVPEALPPAADKAEQSEWQTGTLKRSALTPDGPNRQLYLLEEQGSVKMYVAAGPGVDLDRYLGKRVNVLGKPTSRSPLSHPYVVAMDVEAAR